MSKLTGGKQQEAKPSVLLCRVFFILTTALQLVTQMPVLSVLSSLGAFNLKKSCQQKGSVVGFFSINPNGARCSSVVRAFAHGATGRRIDPSWDGPIELFLVLSSAPRLM